MVVLQRRGFESLYSVSGAIYHECFIQPHRSPLASCWASLRLVACPGWLQRAKVINTCIVILMDPLPRKGIARSPWAFVRAERVSLLTAHGLCGTEINGTRKHVCHHIQGCVCGSTCEGKHACVSPSFLQYLHFCACVCVSMICYSFVQTVVNMHAYVKKYLRMS